MSETYLGQIILVGYNFATRGFALCQGQIQSIAQNSALFSLLGTTYGGDGRTTFGLPNLAGRVAIGQGDAPGLSSRPLGQIGGQEATTLTVGNMPDHTHSATLAAEGASATSSDPTGRLLAQAQTYADPGRAQNLAMSSEAIAVGSSGGSQPFDSMPPFLVMNYQIALQGIFPSRE